MQYLLMTIRDNTPCTGCLLYTSTKNDRKDPKVIAGLVREGRYMIPYLPEGVYACLLYTSVQYSDIKMENGMQ